MSFLEVEFPTAISFGATGGPGFSTTVNQGFSGHEQRNRNWALGLGKWKIDLYQKPKSYFEQVYAFWLNMGGRADSFRFKDHKDFSAVGQLLGEADGSTTQFQLQKTYTLGSSTYVKPITKPITALVEKFDGSACESTVMIYADGAPLVEGTDYELDHTTGVVTLLETGSPAVILGDPVEPILITADFEFHYPVRFDSDDMVALAEESDIAGGKIHVSWPFSLVEVRDTSPLSLSVGASIPCPECAGWLPVPEPEAGQKRLVVGPRSCSSDDGSCGAAEANCAADGSVPGTGGASTTHCGGTLNWQVMHWNDFTLPAWLDPGRVVAVYKVMQFFWVNSGNIGVGGFQLTFGAAARTGSATVSDYWVVGPTVPPASYAGLIAEAVLACTQDDPPGSCFPCGTHQECLSTLGVGAVALVVDYV